MRTSVVLLCVTVFALSTFGSAQLFITGAGATFPGPIYRKWFGDYHKLHADIQINYGGGGSGAGIQQVTEGAVDFGASDAPMSDKEIAAFRAKHNCGVLHFPTVLGAVVPIYNVPGLATDLNFTGEALAGIYLGKITKWNDPAIAKVNPKVKFPDTNIVVVHRSDSSGTSYVFTDYLSKVSPDWKSKVGASKSPAWPIGFGARENPGVAAQVKNTKNSIGYVELLYAKQTNTAYGAVRNKAGVFVKAELQSTSGAAVGVAVPDDFRVSITDAAGKASYPICTATWLLIPDRIADAKKRKAITDFLTWMLTGGQSATAILDFAPLPKPWVAKEMKSIAKIQ